MLGPRSMNVDCDDPGSAPLQRHDSAKQLINRYESTHMPSAPLGSKTASFSELPSEASLKVHNTPFFSKSSKKEKSPIRQSLQSLLSLFRKANTFLEKEEPERPLSTFLRQRHSVLDGSISSPGLKSHSRKPTSTLLYLFRSSASGIFNNDIIWASCTASLEHDSIVISLHDTNLSSHVQVIPLKHSINVRSLAIQQLDSKEAVLLPKSEAGEFKVFEILFEGKSRERLASTSVQERAAWVSAIWDIILPPPTDVKYNIRKDAILADDSRNNLSASSFAEPANTLNQPCVMKAAPPPMKRSLPPIPLRTNTIFSHAPDDYQSMNHSTISSKTLPTPWSYSGSFSRPASPSIINLSKISVVRQRLAQIEPTSPQTSTSSLTTPDLCRVMHSTPPPTPTRSHRKPFSKINMFRDESGHSSVGDSIFDSYVEMDGHISTESALPLALRAYESQIAPTTPEFQAQKTSGTPEQWSPSSTMKGSRRACVRDNPTRFFEEAVSAQDKIYESFSSENGPGSRSDTIARLEAKVKSHGHILAHVDKRMQQHTPSSDDSCIETRGQVLKGSTSIHPKANLESSTEHRNSNTAIVNNRPSSYAKMEREVSKTSPDEISPVSLMPGALEKHSNQTENEYPLATSIMNVLEQNHVQNIEQAQYQAASARYLHDLNAWLGSFVNDGTAQIQDLTSVIDQLRRDLGVEGGTTLVGDLQQLALDAKAKDHTFASLQASLDKLLSILNERFASNVSHTTNLVNRQRQDFEGLVRTLAEEISNEIKGERLRFVEAMKEATAFNVQIHVEQFKKELSREVMEMTEEVGRLHRDRQAMQNQIADLFAFYEKQKVSAEVPCGIHEQRNSVEEYRPLPCPHINGDQAVQLRQTT